MFRPVFAFIMLVHITTYAAIAFTLYTVVTHPEDVGRGIGSFFGSIADGFNSSKGE